jgi:hypothetical protein
MGLLAALPANAGGIAGTVGGPGGVKLASATVTVDSTLGMQVATTATGVHGTYQIGGLAPGNYFVRVSPPVPNPQHYVGAIYAGITNASDSECAAQGTEVVVGSGTTGGIDFELTVGAAITGVVTQAGSGLPVPMPVAVAAVDHRGCFAGADLIDETGAYQLLELAPGPYYLFTVSFEQRVDLLYPSVPCVAGRWCNVFDGTPVSTGSTANFVLQAGSSISGTITRTGSDPVAAEVQIWKGSKRVAEVLASSNGQYTANGLPPGTGYRVLAKAQGLVAEVYPDSPCPNAACNVAGVGTAFDVPAPGTAVTGKDLQLAPGHSISGFVTPTSTGIVQVSGSNGLAGEVPSNGSYTVRDLPDGNYVVRATMAGRLTEVYDNHHCSPDQICPFDLVTVSGADRNGIDFALGAAASIRGAVYSETGDPIAGVEVEVLSTDGTLMSQGTTGFDGLYASLSEGLPPGTYFVRTRLPPWLDQFVDRLWNDRPCGPGCVPAAGNPVTVAGSADTLGIDFVLPFSGLDFYTVAPCRVLDSRGGAPIASGAVVTLRLEGKCSIPGNAVAVSANVTIISASATGSLAVWPANLPSQPPTSTVSFAAGATRANNAILAMSLVGVLNVAARSMPPGGGSYHLLVDVNGYFTGKTP